MSDFPKGGDIAATRAWLDNEGFHNVFFGWKANTLLLQDLDLILQEFKDVMGDSGESRQKARRLFGILKETRQSPPETTGKYEFLLIEKFLFWHLAFILIFI